MNAAQAKADTAQQVLRLTLRAIGVVLFAITLTWALKQTSQRELQHDQPAGFATGVLHGALMPCALPHLLMGNDVTIYASYNTGRTYKLGYTVGVNGCGAIFFGFLYWRFNRWRKANAQKANGQKS